MLLVHAEGEPFAAWMMSLKQPDNPLVSCCGPSDQYYVDEYRADPDALGGFLAMLNGIEVKIRPQKVIQLDTTINPTGRGVIFIARSWEGTKEAQPYVYCFVPGTGV